MKDKICFSKTWVYLVLLVAAVVGFFYVTNYSNKQKLALNSQAASRRSRVIVSNQARVTVPDFTLAELKQRAQTVLGTLTVAKTRSATMDTASIQGQIDNINEKLSSANSSFSDLRQQKIDLLSNLTNQLNLVMPQRDAAEASYGQANLRYVQSIASYGRFKDLYDKAVIANRTSDTTPPLGKERVDKAQTAMESARTAMDQAKIVRDQTIVDLRSYNYLRTLINDKMTSTIKINLSESEKLPKLLDTTISVDYSDLKKITVKSFVDAMIAYYKAYNKTLNAAYDAYNNLDTAIKNAGENVIPTQVQAYTNYCSNVKPGTYYPILGVDQLPLDKAQQYYDDYCGQNSTGYGWNGIIGNYGKPGGAMCYTATGLCSPIADCKKVDCISRIGKGVACLNKPVTDAAGRDACATKYSGGNLKIDILTKNACPQNSSNKIGWYGGRDYKVSDSNGIKTTITSSDTCLRLNAANAGPNSCNQVISDNYCGCKDAGFTYVYVNGTYKNMADELYGNTSLYRPKRTTSKPENLTADGRFEKCPFSL